jgi:hypothetical protein
MTNWPSSCDGGVLFSHCPQLLTGIPMAPLEKTAQKKYQSNAVTDETILKIAKEISIKFIEVGRITPATFEQSFKNIFSAIDTTVKKG